MITTVALIVSVFSLVIAMAFVRMYMNAMANLSYESERRKELSTRTDELRLSNNRLMEVISIKAEDRASYKRQLVDATNIIAKLKEELGRKEVE